MKKILLAIVLISSIYASQYVTVPKREVGILIGSSTADVKVTLIYDPVCDGSADFDKLFQQTFDSLPSDIKSRISLRFISLSLPYHIAAQKLTQGIIYVLQNKGPQQALTLMRDFLGHIDDWSESTLRNQTIGGLMTKIAEKINTLFGLKTEQVLKQLAHGSTTDGKLRQWSKVSMGAIKAAGTPRLMINGVNVDGATSMSSQQLSTLLQDLFKTSEQQKINLN